MKNIINDIKEFNITRFIINIIIFLMFIFSALLVLLSHSINIISDKKNLFIGKFLFYISSIIDFIFYALIINFSNNLVLKNKELNKLLCSEVVENKLLGRSIYYNKNKLIRFAAKIVIDVEDFEKYKYSTIPEDIIIDFEKGELLLGVASSVFSLKEFMDRELSFECLITFNFLIITNLTIINTEI